MGVGSWGKRGVRGWGKRRLENLITLNSTRRYAPRTAQQHSALISSHLPTSPSPHPLLTRNSELGTLHSFPRGAIVYT
uniref:Uncharacterized protein n=1 Tax=Desertifilum tharense IPPAS B-1220 TaxID=1781255 RepID=A0ACD5GZ60_9CYAN